MAVPNARKWRAALFACLLFAGAGQVAHADANGGIAAAIGLTAADGSVRTQTGVRLSITQAPGAADHVLQMSAPVQARMPAIRECFASAMLRSSQVEGSTEFELEASRSGRARVRVTSDRTGDARLVSCMKKSLSAASLTTLPRGARARVGLTLSNPIAAVKRRMDGLRGESQVRIAGGRATGEGGTQAGDVTFRLSSNASDARTVASLQSDVSAHLAGLLDCRRKAFRHSASVGSVELDLRVRAGSIDHAGVRSTLRRGAPQCVEAWLDKLDATKLADADVSLAIRFAP